METTIYPILLVAADVSKASDLSTRIKTHFGEAPVHVDVVEDGSRALYALSKKNYFLVISDVELPIMDGVSLSREIRRIDGGIAIFLLAGRPVSVEEQGIDIIKVPVENWKEFLRKIEFQLPQQVRVKYGLLSQDAELAKMLSEYVKQKIGENPNNSWVGEKPIVQIPAYFDATSTAEISHETRAAVAVEQISDRVSGEKSTKNLLVAHAAEALMLLGLLAVTIYLYMRPVEEEDMLRTVRHVMGAVTVVSFFGFFVSKFVERRQIEPGKTFNRS